jgi:TonB-dependent receptor
MSKRLSTPSLAAWLLLTTALSVPGLAQAQDVPADPEASELDEVVVTGQREAQRQAIAVKRDSFVVADVVSADDIGKLPDHNTAAALRRIPGVSVQEDQGEPRFPILRGLSSTYNRTTIDGAVVASVDTQGRTIPLDIVPSVVAGRLEVIKTVTPENDGNAIGGVINVTTRSAFARGGPFFDGLASLGFYERSGDVRNDKQSYRLSFATGTTFGDLDQFGIVIGGSQEQLDYDIPQIEVANPSVREYTAAGVPVDSGSPLGNGIQVPVQRRTFWYNNTKNRTGANAKLEWRAADTLRFDLSGLYSIIEDDEERIENRAEPIGNVTNQTATSGTFARGRNIIQLNQPITTRSIALVQSGAEWNVSDLWSVTGNLTFSRSTVEEENTSEEFRTVDAQGANYGFTYDTSDFFPIFTPFNEAATRNPANFVHLNRRDATTDGTEEVVEARYDAAFDDGGMDRNLQVKFGGVVRSTEHEVDATQLTYTTIPGFTYTLASVAADGPDQLIAGRYLLTPRVDVALANAFFETNRASFNTATVTLPSDFKVTEDVVATYAQASYRWNDFTLLGGLRYERTEVESDSFRQQGSTFTPVSSQGQYDNILPSLHLRWEPNDRVVVRAAWTNTIGRPNYGDISARETLTFSGSQAILSRGNPGLNPRESEGLDVSFEFYPDDGLISVALFNKDIENEIFTLSSIQNIDLGIGRGVEPVEVRTPQNTQSAKITGIEVAFQQAFTFLPEPFDGFGINLNATLLDTEFTFVTAAGPRRTGFFLQPATTTNATLYYQKGPFEGRISHNYIGGFLETINDTIPNADQYWKGRHLYDASVSWRFDQGVTVFFEAQNLSDSGRQENTGPNRRFLQESAEYGRTFWLGATVSF